MADPASVMGFTCWEAEVERDLFIFFYLISKLFKKYIKCVKKCKQRFNGRVYNRRERG